MTPPSRPKTDVAPKRAAPGSTGPSPAASPSKGARPTRRARPPLELSLQFAHRDDKALLPRHKVARWIRAALFAPAQITVRIVDLEEGRRLNREFRRKDYATNVLTFDYSTAPVIVADLVLCAPVLQREALEQGLDLQAHYAHLLVHGSLHAQGHDHEKAAAARRMEALEGQILIGLGFNNPYHPNDA